MKIKRVGGPPEPVVKVPKLTEKDLAEYERTRTPIVKALEKMGGYLPAVDDYYVDLIAKHRYYGGVRIRPLVIFDGPLYSFPLERFVDPPTACNLDR